MAKTETITCDVCGKAKGPVNHWYMFSETYLSGAFIVLPWNDEVNHLSGHACGQSCITKRLNQWMEK